MSGSFRSLVTGHDGRIVVVQFPNLPILGWAALWLAARFVDDPLHAMLSFFAAAFLFTWAYLELTSGGSPFRRVLGAAVLAWMVAARWPWGG